MHPIFFVWSGADGEVGNTGLMQYGMYSAMPYGGLLFGQIRATSTRGRTDLDGIENLTIMPGPSGSLTAKQVAAIATAFPDAKEGDAFRTVLSVLLTATGDTMFDPDAY